MSPTPSNGLPPTADKEPSVRILEIFPPRSIDPEDAARIATFFNPCAPHPWLAAQLAREPKQQDSFALVAIGEGFAVGYVKLQHGRKGDDRRPGMCWIRELAVESDARRRGIGSGLIRHAWQLIHPHEQLVVEVREDATSLQLFLANAGLECMPLWKRNRRQRDKHYYEFRSVHPSAAPWRGSPRFTWPPVT